MKRYVIGPIIMVASFICGSVMAQEHGPVIIPEQLQKLALEFPVAKRLNIDWGSAGTDDVGRYLGFLAAVNEVAIALAGSNDRMEPSKMDFLAALSIECIFPNNKPPLVEKTWPRQIAAFYNSTVRANIREAIGPEAEHLPAKIESIGEIYYANDSEFLPTNPDLYYKDIFDVRKFE